MQLTQLEDKIEVNIKNRQSYLTQAVTQPLQRPPLTEKTLSR